MKRYLPILLYLLGVHALGLGIQSLLRGIFYIVNIHHLGYEAGLVGQAMLEGLRFDNTISCYIMALPLALWAVSFIMGRYASALVRFSNSYFITLLSLVAMVSSIDVRYYAHFGVHLDESILHWLQFWGTTAGMLWENSYNFVFLALFVVAGFALYWGIISLSRRTVAPLVNGHRELERKLPKMWMRYAMVILTFGLCILGMRGSFAHRPIRVSESYFSRHIPLNHMAISPSFYLIKNLQYRHNFDDGLSKLMTEAEAWTLVSQWLGAKVTQEGIDKPIAPDSLEKRPNVVIILMESIGIKQMNRTYKGAQLMPYLNKLAGESYFFDQFHSAGIHTNNGIMATLFAIPTQFDRSMMESTSIIKGNAFPQQLGRLGYERLFLMTSTPHFDDMQSVLYANEFDRVYSQLDYPSNKIVNSFGVPDSYLFEYGIQRLDEQHKAGRPFLATFLTISNHEPIVIPEGKGYESKGEDDNERILAVADDAIKDFMETAKQKPWYNNTIFVLLGDHGLPTFSTRHHAIFYDYNRIPLIIHSPLLTDTPKRLSGIGCQIDVYPTIMGLIGTRYSNTTLGIDLLKETRPYAFFSADSHLGVSDGTYLFIRDVKEGQEWIHRLDDLEATNLLSAEPERAKAMRDYGVAMMLVSKLQIPK